MEQWADGNMASDTFDCFGLNVRDLQVHRDIVAFVESLETIPTQVETDLGRETRHRQIDRLKVHPQPFGPLESMDLATACRAAEVGWTLGHAAVTTLCTTFLAHCLAQAVARES